MGLRKFSSSSSLSFLNSAVKFCRNATLSAKEVRLSKGVFVFSINVSILSGSKVMNLVSCVSISEATFEC